MVGVIITILLIGLAFKILGFIFKIFGKLLGCIFGLMGYVIIGILAITILGLAIAAFPVIVVVGIAGIVYLCTRVM